MNFIKEVIHSHSAEEGAEKNKNTTSTTQQESKPQSEQGLKNLLSEKDQSSGKEISSGVSKVSLNDVKVESVTQPTVVEKEVEAPVIKEKVVPKVNEVVQPVIYREKEQTEVKHVTQPLYNKDVLPTKLVQAELPTTIAPDTIAKPSAADVAKYQKAHSRDVSSSTVTEPQTERTVLPPIVKETVTPLVHEEIQPVIYQETIQPILITETKPIFHRVVEAPRVVEEIRPLKSVDEASSLLAKVGSSEIKVEPPRTGQSASGTKTGQQ